MMYPEAVSEIIAIRHEFEVELVQKINAILEDIARKTNLEYKCSSDFYSKSKSCNLSFSDKRWDGLEIIFEFDNKDWRNMFVGVADKVHYDEHQSQEYHKLNCFKQKPIYSWTYGWDWIEEKYINWDITCLVDIVKNPDSFKSYITNLVQTIVSNLKDEKIIDNF